ncbi:hypothetical protein [Aureimonas frigidaquae]|uniref:PRC-barrel domain-containing protein n=1 Tax=Aureimonas frigidaquae TaxID=424757 RepID=A0A0P0Z177_9HYPH|nr:hypothetical protein [Aureimonas frigidaquae]BAT27766.1 hypothetical protein [Aureimonas frigidaquae]
MKPQIIGAAMALSILASGASAQVVKIMEMDDAVMVPAFGITVGELEKQALTDAGGNRIGDVEDVIGTAQGPTAIVIDLENSDLDVIVPLERFQNTNGVLTVNMTPAELAALPAYDD